MFYPPPLFIPEMAKTLHVYRACVHLKLIDICLYKGTMYKYGAYPYVNFQDTRVQDIQRQ